MIGSGRTTRAILKAPENSIYVWPSGNSLSYIKQLAHYLGRDDIKIVSLSWLRFEGVRGIDNDIVIDHASWDRFSRENDEAYEIYRIRKEMRKMKEINWFPTMNGNGLTGYSPEYLDPETGKWTDINIYHGTPTNVKTEGNRFPYPFKLGGVLQTIGLCGYNQAMAHAYDFASSYEAVGQHVQVRVQAYEVVYDIKARKLED